MRQWNFCAGPAAISEEVILEENEYGIPEPINGIQINSEIIDVVFVPLLAYDSKGNRER